MGMRKICLSQQFGHIFKMHYEDIFQFVGIDWLHAPISFVEENNLYRGIIRLHVHRLDDTHVLRILAIDVQVDLGNVPFVFSNNIETKNAYKETVHKAIVQGVMCMLDLHKNNIVIEYDFSLV